MNRMIRFAFASLLCAAMGSMAATVSGTVRTGGGVIGGGGGTPVPGAKVVLIGLGGTGGGAVQTRLDSVTTDAQGAYAFPKATTGFRRLVASKTGLSDGNGAANVANDTGHYTVNINMQEAPRTGPGKVMGTVRRGSATGAAVAGATVVLTRGFTGGGNGADSAKTDAQGHYAFDSVAAGNVTLRVTATGYQAGNGNANVPAGDTATADFALMPLNAAGSITGKVTKASDGTPIAGAQVILSGQGGRGGGADTATTNAQGVYSFDSVSVQTNHTLTAKATGFETSVNANVDVALDQHAVADFALVAAGTDPTHGNINGTVSDIGGKPLANARVILARGGGGQQGGAVDTVQTDAQGRFSFTGLTAQANYRLTVSLTGFQTGTDANLDVVAGQTAVSNFTLLSASGILSSGKTSAFPRIAARAAGRLTLAYPASATLGRLMLYDARGSLAFAGAVAAGSTSMEIPCGSGAGYVVIERDGRVDRLPAIASRAAP